MKRIFWLLFALVFVAVGVFIAYLGFQDMAKAKASAQWPTTQGAITESSVERHHRKSGNRSSTTFHAKVLYEFSVGGNIFTGDRVAYGDFDSSFTSHAQKIVARYPQGQSVTVYYLPENPSECLLEPGLKAQAWFMPGIGALFFMAGCLMTAQMLRTAWR